MFLSGLNAAALPHSRRSLLQHLEGTQSLLVSWGQPIETCCAGLLHAVYGTESFKAGQCVVERHEVARVVGTEVEYLVFLFHARSGEEFLNVAKLLAQETGWALLEQDQPFFSRESQSWTVISSAQFRALAAIQLANALDQARYLPELYSRAYLNSLQPLALLTPGASDSFEEACTRST